MSVAFCTSLLNAINPYKLPNDSNSECTRTYDENYLNIVLSFFNLKLNMKNMNFYLNGVDVSGSIYTCVAMHLYDNKISKAPFLRELVANYILSLDESYFSDIMKSVYPLFMQSEFNFTLQNYAQVVKSGIEDFLQVGILGKLCKLLIFVVFADYPLPFGWHEAVDMDQHDMIEPLWVCYSPQKGFQTLKTCIYNHELRIDQNIFYGLKKNLRYKLVSPISEKSNFLRPTDLVLNTPKDELYLGLNLQFKILKFYTSSLNSIENGFFTGILNSIQNYMKKLESSHKLLNRVAFISPPGLKKLINYVFAVHLLDSVEYKELIEKNSFKVEKQGYFRYESKTFKPSWAQKIYWKPDNREQISHIIASAQFLVPDVPDFVKIKIPKQLQCSVSLRFGRVGIKIKFLSWNQFGIFYQSYMLNNCSSSMFESFMVRSENSATQDFIENINYLDAEIEDLLGSSVEWIPPTRNLSSALASVQQYINKLSKNTKISCLISHIQITLPNLLTKTHGEIIELSNSPLFSEKCQKFTSKVSAVVLQLQNHSRICKWVCDTLPRMLSASFYNSLLDPNANSKIAFFVTSLKDMELSDIEKIIQSLNFGFQSNSKLKYDCFTMPRSIDLDSSEIMKNFSYPIKIQKFNLYTISDQFSKSKNVSQLVHFLLKFLWSGEGLSRDRLFLYNYIIVPLISRLKIHQLRILEEIEASNKHSENFLEQQFLTNSPNSISKVVQNLKLLKPDFLKEFYIEFNKKIKKWNQKMFHIIDQYKERLYTTLNDEEDYASIVWLHNYLLTLCELYNSPMPLVINYLIQPPLDLDLIGLENLLCGFIITSIKTNFESAIKDLYDFLIREAFSELTALIGNNFVPSKKVIENLYISSELHSLQGVIGSILLKFSAPNFEKLDKKIRVAFKPLINNSAANIKSFFGVLAPNFIFRHFIVVEYPNLKAQAFKVALEIWEKKLKSFVEQYLNCVQSHVPKVIQKFLNQLEFAYVKCPKYEKNCFLNNNFSELLIKLMESDSSKFHELNSKCFDKFSQEYLFQDTESKPFEELLVMESDSSKFHELNSKCFDKFSQEYLFQDTESKPFEELLELINKNANSNSQNKSQVQDVKNKKDLVNEISPLCSHGMTYTTSIIHSVFMFLKRVLIEVNNWIDSSAVEQKIINHFKFYKFEHQQIILCFFSMISNMLKIADLNNCTDGNSVVSNNACCNSNRKTTGNSVYFYFSSVTNQWLPEEDIALLFMTISHKWTEICDQKLEPFQFSYSFLFDAARFIVRSKACRSIWEIRDRLVLYYKRFGSFNRALEFFFHKQPVLVDLCNFFKFDLLTPISNNLREYINNVASRFGLESVDMDHFWFLLKKTLHQVKLEHPQVNLEDIIFVLSTQNQKKELDDEENGMTLLAYLYTGLQNPKDETMELQNQKSITPPQLDILKHVNLNENLFKETYWHESNAVIKKTCSETNLVDLDGRDQNMPVQNTLEKGRQSVDFSKAFLNEVTQPYPNSYSLVVNDVDRNQNYSGYKAREIKASESVMQQKPEVSELSCTEKSQDLSVHDKSCYENLSSFNQRIEKVKNNVDNQNFAIENASVRLSLKSSPAEFDAAKFDVVEVVEKSVPLSPIKYSKSKIQSKISSGSQKSSISISNDRNKNSQSLDSDAIVSNASKSDPSLFYSMKEDFLEEKLVTVGKNSRAGCKPKSRARKGKKKQSYVYSDQEDDIYEEDDVDYLVHSDFKGSSSSQEKCLHSLDYGSGQPRPYRKRRKFDCSVVDLIRLGYLHIGDTVAAFKQTGTVVSEGLAFKELVFDNPSAFAARCLIENAAKLDPLKKVVSNYNGWDYVKYRGKKLGYWRSLCCYETGYQSQNSAGESKSG